MFLSPISASRVEFTLNAKDIISSSSAWNMKEYAKVNQDTLSIKKDPQFNEVLYVVYKQDSGAPHLGISGGYVFHSIPDKFPSRNVQLKYNIRFDPEFDWVKGGKIGLGLNIGNYGSTGGNHPNNSASIRLMWRKNGDAELYIYLDPSITQDSSYDLIENLVVNKDYGDSWWRGIFKWKKQVWNSVTISAKMNSFSNNLPNKDGVVRLTINNTTKTFSKVILSKYPDTKITGILGSTFFGGSDSSWATPKDTFTELTNCQVVLENAFA